MKNKKRNLRGLKALMILTTLGLTAMSSPLTPSESLSRALGAAPTKLRGQNAGVTFRLARTIDMPTRGGAGVYVFNRSDNGAFIVTSADDAGYALLGYSDNGVFDPENIAPGLECWLEMYAGELEAAINAGATTNVEEPQSRADHAVIEPMLTTQWGQETPFNQKTPVLSGMQTPTGCVATAFAQVMNYHEWPKSGLGESSYTFKYNNQNYTLSFNYGSTEFDWANMIDNYTGNYTAVQANAVATLMYGIGVATQMSYGPNASGTSDLMAGPPIINHFRYDKSMTYMSRDWFFLSQWKDIILNELENHRPVAYAGMTKDGLGHEFVCDGYAGEDFYHFNWGWEGMSDGNFRLTSLSPSQQGTGGSASNYSFDYSQSIYINFMPEQTGSDYTIQWMAEGFTTNQMTYSRDRNSQIPFNGPFYNMSMTPVKVGLGVRLVYTDGSNVTVDQVVYPSQYVGTMELGEGVSFFPAQASMFPEGEYDVYPAIILPNGEFSVMRYNVLGLSPLHFKTNSETITVSQGTPSPDPDVLTYFSTFKGWNSSELVRGESYTATFDIMASRNTDAVLQAIVVNPRGSITARSAQIETNLVSEVAKSFDFTLKMATTMSTTNEYRLIVCYLDESGTPVQIGDAIPFKVVASSGLETLETETAGGSVYYDLQGRRAAHPTNGFYIRRHGDGSVERVFIR